MVSNLVSRPNGTQWLFVYFHQDVKTAIDEALSAYGIQDRCRVSVIAIPLAFPLLVKKIR